MTDEECKQHLMCWMFRHAQKTWNKTSLQTSEIFREYDLYTFIRNGYEWMHYASYESAFSDMNSYLNNKGVFPNA